MCDMKFSMYIYNFVTSHDCCIIIIFSKWYYSPVKTQAIATIIIMLYFCI